MSALWHGRPVPSRRAPPSRASGIVRRKSFPGRPHLFLPRRERSVVRRPDAPSSLEVVRTAYRPPSPVAVRRWLDFTRRESIVRNLGSRGCPATPPFLGTQLFDPPDRQPPRRGTMPSRLLRCHTCDVPFESRIPRSERASSGAMMDAAIQRCPYCGSVDSHFSHGETAAEVRGWIGEDGALREARPSPLIAPDWSVAARLGVFEGDVQRAIRRRPSTFGTVP